MSTPPVGCITVSSNHQPVLWPKACSLWGIRNHTLGQETLEEVRIPRLLLSKPSLPRLQHAPSNSSHRICGSTGVRSFLSISTTKYPFYQRHNSPDVTGHWYTTEMVELNGWALNIISWNQIWKSFRISIDHKEVGHSYRLNWAVPCQY